MNVCAGDIFLCQSRDFKCIGAVNTHFSTKPLIHVYKTQNYI